MILLDYVFSFFLLLFSFANCIIYYINYPYIEYPYIEKVRGLKIMTREDYIRTLIKSHGYTLKDFAKLIHMPYTTLLSILNGSIGGAAMDNVLKICQALNLRIEELNQLSGKDGPVPDAPKSEDGIDTHLLELIRSLPPEKQVALKILLANR